MKYLVFRHPLPDPPSRSPEEYEATGYRLMGDILPSDLVDELCALQLDGDENSANILLHARNQGDGRQPNDPGKVNKWLPPEIKWRLIRILANVSPSLDDLVDTEPLGVLLEGVRRNPPLLGTARTAMCTRLQCLKVTVGVLISVLSPKQA